VIALISPRPCTPRACAVRSQARARPLRLFLLQSLSERQASPVNLAADLAIYPPLSHNRAGHLPFPVFAPRRCNLLLALAPRLCQSRRRASPSTTASCGRPRSFRGDAQALDTPPPSPHFVSIRQFCRCLGLIWASVCSSTIFIVGNLASRRRPAVLFLSSFASGQGSIHFDVNFRPIRYGANQAASRICKKKTRVLLLRNGRALGPL